MTNAADIPMRTPLQQRVELETIGMVCRYTVNAFMGLVVIGAVLAYIASIDYPDVYAWGWYALMVALAGVRWQCHREFLKVDRQITEFIRWRVLITSGGALTGLGWCVPATWMMPDSVVNQLFVCACLMGVVSAAMAALAPLRGAFPWFVVPLLLPAAIAQFLQGGNQIYVGLGLLVFLSAMLGVALRYHHDSVRMLTLALENKDLAARLSSENQRVAQGMSQLQEQMIERQRAEQAAQIAKAEAEDASRAKSQFLANVSHEVRTPLNAVMGMMELLRRTPLDPRQAKYADTAFRASERLLGIINDILDLARIEAGHLRVHTSAFDPRVWLDEVIDLMHPQAVGKSLSLTHEIAADVPTQIEGDAERLRQVLTNLLSNAVKFTNHGSVHVALRVERHSANAASLRCEVTDTGLGIPADAQARLFQPFSQVDDTTTRRFGGAGLGLAICSQLIQAMHGDLGVRSTVGDGSTFWFCVPLKVVAPTIHVGVDATANATTPLRARVLVAEDIQLNRELIVDMLALAGCTVCAVESGEAALRMLDRESFDGAIIDWHMPEVDGLSAIRQWRERERAGARGHLPMIVLTASAMPGDREICLQAGADEYLSKPFTYETLVTALRTVLR